MEEKTKPNILDSISRFLIFIIVMSALTLLLLTRFNRGFISIDQFSAYYLYIACLFCFLAMFFFSTQILRCRKLRYPLLNITFCMVVFFISPFIIKVLSFAIILNAIVILMNSKEYLQMRKQALEEGQDPDSLC